ASEMGGTELEPVTPACSTAPEHFPSLATDVKYVQSASFGEPTGTVNGRLGPSLLSGFHRTTLAADRAGSPSRRGGAHRFPDPRGGVGRVEMADPERRERVRDGVGDGGGRPDRSPLTDALRAQRVVRRRGLPQRGRELRQRLRRR